MLNFFESWNCYFCVELEYTLHTFCILSFDPVKYIATFILATLSSNENNYVQAGLFMDSKLSTGRLPEEKGVPENGVLMVQNGYDPRDPPTPDGQSVWTEMRRSVLNPIRSVSISFFVYREGKGCWTKKKMTAVMCVDVIK